MSKSQLQHQAQVLRADSIEWMHRAEAADSAGLVNAARRFWAAATQCEQQAVTIEQGI